MPQWGALNKMQHSINESGAVKGLWQSNLQPKQSLPLIRRCTDTVQIHGHTCRNPTCITLHTSSHPTTSGQTPCTSLTGRTPLTQPNSSTCNLHCRCHCHCCSCGCHMLIYACAALFAAAAAALLMCLHTTMCCGQCSSWHAFEQ